MVIRMHRDKNILAYKGKNNQLIRILTTTESGAIAQYEYVDDPGNIYMPLIEDGKNVEEFKIIGEQLGLL